jgi:DNA-binding transcriptional MerR regulator
MKQSFTSSQVSQRTGLTPRQLQWWDEQGIVVPARQGHYRLYSAEDLAELAILSGLRRRGFSLQRIRGMLGLLRREFGRRLSDLLSRGPDLHVLTDGESVFLCDSERGVIDLLRNTQQPLLEICAGSMLECVPASMELPEARTPETTQQAGISKQVKVVKQPKQANPAPKKSSQSARPARAGRTAARN